MRLRNGTCRAGARSAARVLRWVVLAATAMSGCTCLQPVAECEPPADAGPNYHDTCTTAADCRTGNFWYCGGEVFRQPSCINGRCLYDRFRNTCTVTSTRLDCGTFSSPAATAGCNPRCTLEVGLSNCPMLRSGSRWVLSDDRCRGTLSSADGGDVLGTWQWYENGTVIADFPRLGGLCSAGLNYWACTDCEAFVDVVDNCGL